MSDGYVDVTQQGSILVICDCTKRKPRETFEVGGYRLMCAETKEERERAINFCEILKDGFCK